MLCHEIWTAAKSCLEMDTMADYPEMYRLLFRSVTQAITILQEAQQSTEDMFVSAEPVNVRLLGIKPAPDNDDSGDDDSTK